MRRSLAISFVLHVAILMALATYVAPPRSTVPARGDAVEVVLVPAPPRRRPSVDRAPVDRAPQEIAPAAPEAAPAPDASPETAPGKDTGRMALAPPRRGKPDLVPATKLYAGAALASPLGRATLAQLEQTDREERIVQLCNYEAVEQVRRKHPKLRIDYALAQVRSEAKLTGLTVEAEGAAVQGRGKWYDLAFRCEVAADLAGVDRFAFALGARIPRPDLERLGLPEGEPVD